jgi:Rrf2 family protein
MRLSTKTRYGTRAVLDIALHAQQGPVHLGDISERQEISRKYLGQIIGQLLTAGILESIRGPQGGYILNRLPNEIRLGEIIRTLDGSLAPVRCVDKPDLCNRTERCVTREVWTKAKESMESLFDQITVADLMERQEELDTLTSP